MTIDMVPIRSLPKKGGRPRLWTSEELDRIEVTLEQSAETLAGSRGHKSYWTAYWRGRRLQALLNERGVLVEARTWHEHDGWRWGIKLIGFTDPGGELERAS